MVLPGGSSRSVGYGSASRTGPARPHGQGKEDSRPLAQTGKIGYMYILNRAHRRAGVRHRGKAGPAKQGSRRAHLAHPADSGETSGACAAFRFDPATEMVTAADTNEAHAKACADWRTRADRSTTKVPSLRGSIARPARPRFRASFSPARLAEPTGAGMSADPRDNYVFVNTSDYASIGWIEKMPAQFARPLMTSAASYGAPVPVEILGSQDGCEGSS